MTIAVLVLVAAVVIALAALALLVTGLRQRLARHAAASSVAVIAVLVVGSGAATLLVIRPGTDIAFTPRESSPLGENPGAPFFDDPSAPSNGVFLRSGDLGEQAQLWGKLVENPAGCLGFETESGEFALAAWPQSTRRGGETVVIGSSEAVTLGEWVRFAGGRLSIEEVDFHRRPPRECRTGTVWTFTHRTGDEDG